MKELEINIAICDDTEIDLNLTRQYLDEVLSLLELNEYNYSIRMYTHPDFFLLDDFQPDFVLLDIVMPSKSGFEVAEVLKNRKRRPFILFLTDHDELMSEGYEFDAFRYLTKPINKLKFEKAVKQVINRITDVEWIKIEYLEEAGIKQKEFIRSDEIIFIETNGKNKSLVNTTTQTYEVNKSVNDWIKQLPYPQFFQCHRSYIINVEYCYRPLARRVIKAVEIELSTGDKVDVARNKVKELNHAIHELIRRKGRRK